MAHLPIFFLFFNQIVGLQDVLLLESIYYISVVLIEVPSGYYSDSIGRKKTLTISTLLFVLAYVVFGLATSFILLAVAQVCLAGAISFRSGTDTSFYYESLEQIDKADEYADREAKIQSWIQMASAFAVLVGGFLGSLALNLPYFLSAILILPALIICFYFTEPEQREKEITPFFKQLSISFSYLKNHQLRWLFYFAVLMYAMTHVPYEFYQPYLKLLENKGDLFEMNAPIASGILFALTRFVAAFAARFSVVWTKKYGFLNLLFVALLIQAIIIGLLAWKLHVLIVLIVLFRNFSMVLTKAPINAVIAPLVNQSQRATYFSIQSLAFRLSFAVILIALALPFGDGHITDWSALSWMLRVSLIGSVIFTILLYMKTPNKIEL